MQNRLCWISFLPGGSSGRFRVREDTGYRQSAGGEDSLSAAVADEEWCAEYRNREADICFPVLNRMNCSADQEAFGEDFVPFSACMASTSFKDAP